MEITYTRAQLTKLYESYPDVVDLKQFREMLGGICDSMARRLIQGDYVEHFVIGGTYLIPKKCVIDYILSRHYKVLQLKLKHHIQIPDLWNGKVKD